MTADIITSDITICDDCAMVLANGIGSLDDTDTEERIADRIQVLTEDGSSVTGPDCNETCVEFSKSQCDVCKTHLAGRRHRATYWPPATNSQPATTVATATPTKGDSK